MLFFWGIALFLLYKFEKWSIAGKGERVWYTIIGIIALFAFLNAIL